MDIAILIAVSVCALGVMIGAVVRSPSALLYPVVLTGGWGLWVFLNDGGSGEGGSLLPLLVLLVIAFVPAVLGVVIGYGIGKAVERGG